MNNRFHLRRMIVGSLIGAIELYQFQNTFRMNFRLPAGTLFVIVINIRPCSCFRERRQISFYFL